MDGWLHLAGKEQFIRPKDILPNRISQLHLLNKRSDREDEANNSKEGTKVGGRPHGSALEEVVEVEVDETSDDGVQEVVSGDKSQELLVGLEGGLTWVPI